MKLKKELPKTTYKIIHFIKPGMQVNWKALTTKLHPQQISFYSCSTFLLRLRPWKTQNFPA